MGYTTDFYGEFKLDRPLTPEQRTYLNAFNQTRRMKRDPAKTERRPDPVRVAVGLPIGPEGAYFVGAGEFHGQENTDDVISFNDPPSGQPGLWCQWVPNEDGTAIEWDQGEKFYDYQEWLVYLIDHFLKPWGYTLNGVVEFQGEERDDRGQLVVEDNRVGVQWAETKFGKTRWS